MRVLERGLKRFGVSLHVLSAAVRILKSSKASGLGLRAYRVQKGLGSRMV